VSVTLTVTLLMLKQVLKQMLKQTEHGLHGYRDACSNAAPCHCISHSFILQTPSHSCRASHT
jgi:hypothetical protein